MPVPPEVTPSTIAPQSAAGSRGALLLALAMLGGGLAWVAMLAIQQCDGQWAYALDDAYIHLAIAKNLALHGNWGISPHRFSTASSSLAWPAATSAAFLLFGVRESVLLVFNVFAAGLAVVIPWSIFAPRKPPTWLLIVMLGILILATPIIPLVLSGMEHLAHAVVSLLFLYSACQGMVDPERRACGLRATTAALLLAPCVTALRYEGMFLITAVAALYLLRGQWPRAIAVAAIGMLPVGLAGIWFVSQGWFFFPASVVLKSQRPDMHSLASIWDFVLTALGRMQFFPHLPALIVVVAVSTFGLGRRLWHETAGLMGIAFLAVAIMHALFGGLGWFYRYEAYLVYLGLVVLMLQWLDCYRDSSAGRPLKNGTGSDPHRANPERKVRCEVPVPIFQYTASVVLSRRRWVLLALFVALALPIGYRSFCAHRETAQACTNIYQQQVQMALFLREYYPGATVAANDVGAINFFADIDCVDLVGLADLEIAKATLAGVNDAQEINRVARGRGATIALVHKSLFGGGAVPHTWIEVGSLEIQNNVVCYDPTVSFYAIDFDALDDLRRHFRRFESRLPAGVQAFEANPASWQP